MKVKIQIDTKTFVRFFAVGLTFFLVILAIYSARSALTVIFTAFFIALALNAPVSFLVKYLPGKNRLLATATSYFGLIAIIAGFIFLAVPPVIEQTIKFVNNTPVMAERVTERWKGVDRAIDSYGLREEYNNTLKAIKDNSTHWVQNVGFTVIDGAGSILAAAVNIFLVLVLAFLMLLEAPRLTKDALSFYKDKEKREHHKRILTRMYSIVKAYVNGQLLVALIAAACSGLAVMTLSWGFAEINANLSLPVMAIVFLFTLIPMFGATIGGILVALLLALNDVMAAGIFVVFFVVYQQIENNILSPAIQSRSLDLSALAVLIAVTIGIYTFGIAGGIISIPIAGCLKVLAQEYFIHNKEKEAQKNDKGFGSKMASLLKKS